MAGFLNKLALLSMSTVAAGHMIMANPKPFGNPDNGPISSATFPCKVTGDPAKFFERSNPTKMAQGSTQKLSFSGSAVHGGGSCQLAVTKDLVPTKTSTWQVILSIHGGCPSKTGDGASDYDFKIPAEIAAGEYVFAWTWISKMAGQPEYYMNCAPITVTGGSAKRDDDLAMTERQAALPNLFVANLAEINSCKAGPGVDPVFPDPGPNVMTPNPTAKLEPIPGPCFPGGAGAPLSSAAPKPTTTSVNAGNPQPSSAAGNPQTSSAAGSSQTSSAAAKPTGGASTMPGGVFITVKPSASSSGAAAPTPSANQTTLSTTTKSAASTTQNAAAPTATTGGSGSGSDAGAKTGACSSEGMFNCIGGTQFQQCASGSWSAARPMAAGTQCKAGESTTLFARGSILGRRVRVAMN